MASQRLTKSTCLVVAYPTQGFGDVSTSSGCCGLEICRDEIQMVQGFRFQAETVAMFFFGGTSFRNVQFQSSPTSASSRLFLFFNWDTNGHQSKVGDSDVIECRNHAIVRTGWNPCDPRFQVPCFWILNVFDTVWLKMAQMNFICTGSESSHAFRYASFPGSRSIEEGEGHRVLVYTDLSVTSWSQDNVWDVFGLVSH